MIRAIARWGAGCAMAVVAAACHHPAKPPVVTNQAKASPCGQVADHMMEILADDARDVDPDRAKAARGLFAQHCTDDEWSAEVQRCFLAIETKADGDKCAAKLSDDQRAAIESAAQRAGRAAAKAPPVAPAPAGAAPPPPPAPKPSISGDPTEGGE